MIVQAPWLLLLIVPIMLFLWQHRHPNRSVNVLRVLLSILVLMGLTQPRITLPSSQQDLIVVVDRSDSMPNKVEAYSTEWIQSLESDLKTGDRKAVMSIATDMMAEQMLGTTPFTGFQAIDSTGQSNLSKGLLQALQLLEPSSQGKIVLISDGAQTDGDFHTVQAQAMAQGVPIHTIYKGKQSKSDIRITKVQSPSQIKEGDQASIIINIESPVAQTSNLILYKDDIAVAQGAKDLRAGNNSVYFNDVPSGGGVHTYKVVAEVSSDDTPNNNVAEFGVLVQGKRRVLVLSLQDSVLTDLLNQSGILVTEAHPSSITLSRAKLSQFESIIVHNVPSTAFTESELQSIATAVEHSGLGLWMIGGEQSFGVGGYLHTPLEEVLPVNLEIRDDVRKMGIALGVSLDRSGSMSAPVGPNLTKMNLANQGTAAALTLLNNMDSVYVAAVDTENHVVVPFQEVSDVQNLTTNILGIESTGGGIFVGAALEAQHQALKDSTQKNRHVILFADAADAERDMDHKPIIQRMRADDITISVIALGQPNDSDAGFLAEVARLGGGSIYFSVHPKELPKLFSMDTMIATQAGYIVESTPTKALAGLTALGGSALKDFPTIEAYNISYPKGQTQLGVQTGTEDSSPILVHGQYGLGKSVAYLGDIGGPAGQNILRWPGFQSFVGVIVASISTGATADTTYTGSIQKGNLHELTVETKDRMPAIQMFQPNGDVVGVDLSANGENLYTASYTTTEIGIYIPQLQTASGTVLLPPISTVTSSEYTQNVTNDKQSLSVLSQRTNGLLNPTPQQVLDQESLQPKLQSLDSLWIWLTIGFLVMEISERKLGWVSAVVNSLMSKRWVPVLKSPTALKITDSTDDGKDNRYTLRKSTQEKVALESSEVNNASKPQAPRTNSIKEALKQAKKKK